MKKDVNFTLFSIIALLLISIVMITIYYNSTYRKLNSDYWVALEDMEKTREELNRTASEIQIKNDELLKKEKSLIDIINELNLSNQRVTSLGEYYADLKGEKEDLESDITEITGERDSWKSEYTSARVDLDYCQRNYESTKIQLMNANASLSKLQNMGDDIKGYADDGKGYVNDIEDIKITDIKNQISALTEQIRALDSACESGTIDDLQDVMDDNVNDIYKAVNDIKEVAAELNKLLIKIMERTT